MKNRIKELREKYNMTQIKLSTELEVSQETVSAYEKGKHYPSMSSLLKLTTIFDASMDYIMGLSNIKKPLMKSDLQNDEIELLIKYQQLNDMQKEKIKAYLDGLSN